jgi:hypothetical protein
MSQKHSRKARKIIRGFQLKEPMRQGTDHLWDLKIQKELMKMMSEAHLQEVKQHMPKDEAERMVIGWLDDSPHKEDEKL